MANELTLSAQTARLERTPAPYGKPGGPGLYGVKGLKHSDYFEQIVKAMKRNGKTDAEASAMAWGILRRWARGGGNVHPEVKAAAIRALAEEKANSAKAKAVHGHTNTVGIAVQLHGTTAGASKIPRNVAGQFTAGKSGTSASSAKHKGGKQRQAKIKAIRGKLATVNHEIRQFNQAIQADRRARRQMLSAQHAAKTHTTASGAAASAAKAAAAGTSSTAATSSTSASGKTTSSTSTSGSRASRLSVLNSKIATDQQRLASLRAQRKQLHSQLHALGVTNSAQGIVVQLAEHVRTPAGEAWFHLPIGSLIEKHSHSELLAMRKDMQSKFPRSDERVKKIRRAVEQSRAAGRGKGGTAEKPKDTAAQIQAFQAMASSPSFEHLGGLPPLPSEKKTDYHVSAPPPPVVKKAGVHPSEVRSSQTFRRNEPIYYPTSRERRMGKSTVYAMSNVTPLEYKGKTIGSVRTTDSGRHSLSMGNKEIDMYGVQGDHAAAVEAARGLATSELNTRKVRSALVAAGHSTVKSHATRIKGWRNYDPGFQVGANREGTGVTVTHYRGSRIGSSLETDAKVEDQRLQQYHEALTKKGFVVDKVPDKNFPQYTAALHVANKKQGGGA